MSFPKNEPSKIVLYRKVCFDSKYETHPFMSSKWTKNYQSLPNPTIDEFLNSFNHDNPIFPNLELSFENHGCNFNFGNGLLTTLTIEVPIEFTDANYLKVYFVSSQKPYYYFIKSMVQNNALENSVVCTLTLELDVLSTYTDEFLEGVKDVPICIERKHDYRFSQETPETTNFYCCDLALDEPIFKNIKPSIISKVEQINFKIQGDTNHYVDGQSNMLWVYMWYDTGHTDYVGSIVENYMYNCLFTALPLLDTDYWFEYEHENIVDRYRYNTGRIITKLSNEGKIYSLKISPYPPFTTLLNDSVSYDSFTEEYSFRLTSLSKIGDVKFDAPIHTSGSNDVPYNIKTKSMRYSSRENYYIVPFSSTRPTTQTLRSIEYEPKCQVPPIKKYEVRSMYSQGYELKPQLELSVNGDTNYDGLIVTDETLFTGYPIDNTITTNIRFYHGDIDLNYNYGNIALNGSPIYSLPYGIDAVKYFNETQGNTFAVNKVSQAIGGLVASVGGGVMLATGNPLGAVGIVGGVASLGNSIGSAVGKYNDLSNTPDTISSNGSSYIRDLYMGSLMPYIMYYECTPSEQEMFLDYFYDYGYTCQRCCYFNTELLVHDFKLKNYVDTNVFTRQVFNYVKTNEDISNKIHSDIPPICKEKISSIFRNGIKLYTMFNLQQDLKYGYGEKIYNYYDNNKYENAEII